MKPIGYLLLLLLCWPLVASAELPDKVTTDFSVVKGVVVMPINDEFIVDLDKSNNLFIGDLLAVVEPGKKIFHPETREVIGTIDDVLGFLQVTRIHSGYSYARAVSDGLAPQSGSQVRRFEQVPALLSLSADANGELARQIRNNLPQFKWLETDSATTALLTFNLSADNLDVRTAEGDVLHKYNITTEQQLVSSAITTPSPTVTTKSKPKRPLQRLADSLVGAVGGSTNEDRFAEMDEAIIRQKQRDRQGIWLGPNIDGDPRALTVAELDGDGLQETAVILDSRLLIVRIAADEFTELATVKLPLRLNILNMNAVDLDGNGSAELYLTALDGKYNAASLVVEWTVDGFAITQQDIPWLLHAVQLPGETSPTLLGQLKANAEQPFYGSVFRVVLDGESLGKGDPLELPSKLNVFNFLPFTDERGQLNYAYMTPGDYLNVMSAEGVGLWESSTYFGGSENCYFPREPARDEMMMQNCMPQRLLPLPGGEILVAQNEGQRVVKNVPLYKNGRLVSLAWNGYALVESWRTASQHGYMADFAMADADNDGSEELVMIVRFQKKGLIDDARSSVVIYELE